MLKFGLYTDTHLIGIGPEKRIDDYPKNILAKIRECYSEFKKHDAEFAVFAGDMFDSHRIYSYDTINELLDIMEDFGKKTYFIMGQHDLYGYSKDTYPKSTLRFVEKRSRGLFELVVDNVELDNCIIHASHVYDKVAERLSSIEKSDKFQITLVHELLNNKTAMFDVVATNDLPDNNVDLVLSGDLHDGYDFHEIGGTSYYNPGSIARTKNSKSNRKKNVKCGLFTVDKQSDGFHIDLKEVELTSMLSAEEVFKKDMLEDIDENYSINVDEFVKEIEELDVETIEIFELVMIVGKQTNVDESLMDYIMKFRSEPDEQSE